MRRSTFIAIAIVVIVLAVLSLKSMLLPIAPMRQQNAATEFDAVRAKARLARILGDQAPHPADSPANDAVRGRLVAELQSMGLRPIVRDQFACNDFQKARLVACARVRNVIAIIGPPTGKALLLSAHYDSVPVGPGAADDGIGVATLLEVGSLLKQRPLKRPVFLLFNEGEELGLVGARAFLSDPLSHNVDSLLNFEARGVTGPATMFETSQPNGPAMAAYSTSVQHPYASSLSTDFARLIPNDTDVTTYKERGWLTLNFAIVGNETHYHSPGDDLASLDVRSLQHMGDQGLAIASRLAAGEPQATGSRIFADVGERLFLNLPLAAGAIILVVGLIAFAWIGRRRGALIRGSAVVLSAMVAGSAAAWLAVTIMGFIRSGIYWRAHPGWAFAAIYATVLFAALAVLLGLGRDIRSDRLRPSFWFMFLLLGGLLAIAAPGAIIYFLIAPALVLTGILIGRRWPPAEQIASMLALISLFIVWGELLAALEELFSPGPLWVVAPLGAIVIVAALVESQAVFAGASRRLVLIGSAVVALVAWVVAGLTPAYSTGRQQRFTVEHVTDFAMKRTHWAVANDGADLPPAYPPAGQWSRGEVAYSGRPRWLAAAPAVGGLKPPSAQIAESIRNGNERSVRLRLAANGAERIVLIAPDDAHFRSAGVPGFMRPLGDSDAAGKFTITCTGRSCDGLEMLLDFGTGKPVTLTMVGSRNGLPASAAPLLAARPRIARPQYTPDETVTVSRVRV